MTAECVGIAMGVDQTQGCLVTDGSGFPQLRHQMGDGRIEPIARFSGDREHVLLGGLRDPGAASKSKADGVFRNARLKRDI